MNDEAEHCFEAHNKYQSSLSVYNKPKDLINRRPHSAHWTQHELLKDMPGYKPPTQPVNGEAPAPIEEMPVMKDPVLPTFLPSEEFELITKDATDVMR